MIPHFPSAVFGCEGPVADVGRLADARNPRDCVCNGAVPHWCARGGIACVPTPPGLGDIPHPYPVVSPRVPARPVHPPPTPVPTMDEIRYFLQSAKGDPSALGPAVLMAARMPQSSVSLKQLQQFGGHAEKNMAGTLISASAFLSRELPIRKRPRPPALPALNTSTCLCGSVLQRNRLCCLPALSPFPRRLRTPHHRARDAAIWPL